MYGALGSGDAGIALNGVEVAAFTLEQLGVVDGEYERDFDDLTTLATDLLGAEVSLVSIVQTERDRQYFKSHIGLAQPWADRRETPLSHSFCQHVAASDEVLRVDDARLDDRVSDNRAIPDLGVIAYLGAPIHDQRGQAIGALCVIEPEPRGWTDADITTLRRLANCVDNVIRLKAELLAGERKSDEMRDLVYALSHDFKAPATTMVRLVDELTAALPEGERDAIAPTVHAMQRTADGLGNLIDDLLAYVATLSIDPWGEPVDLNEVAAGAIEDLADAIDSIGATVQVGALPTIVGDRTQLTRLVHHLIANAVRYHRPGVEPRVDVWADDDVEAGMARFTVSDNGIGIPERMQAAVFGLFVRLDTEAARRRPASGIGLTTCRRVVSNHDGSLTLASEEGVGTTITVTLPLDRYRDQA